MLNQIRQALAAGALKPNVFTQHLIEDAKIIRNEEDFGEDLENLDWLTNTKYYGPGHYFTEAKDTKLAFRLDFDFTGFVSETLELIRGSWEMVICPNYNVRLQSCKMRYKGKSLHTCPSIGIG